MFRFLAGWLLVVGCGSVTGDEAPVDAPPIEADGPDAPTAVTMTELRALPDGPVNVLLEASRVTYVRNRSLHLQANTVGPATFIFVPANGSPPNAVIGNTLELHVTEVSTFEGNKEITKATIVNNDEAIFDISMLAQTLTTAPNEDLESELVKIQRGTVMTFAPPSTFMVQLTSAAIVEVFSPVGMSVGLCPGATFDLTAVITEFQGRHEVTSTVATDFTNVNTAACP